MGSDYFAFLQSRNRQAGLAGFDPDERHFPEEMFLFQRSLDIWACRLGRAAIFADCGMGKSLLQLVWADQVRRHVNKPVLILAPLAVTHQTAREAERFGIEGARVCASSADVVPGMIAITNYQKLHHFDRNDFGGVVCDESSILKNFTGKTRKSVTEFLRPIPYRLLCTATAAPNDYVELGNSAEALGQMGFRDMATRFFKQETVKDKHGWGRTKFRMRPHAERDFWRWVCSWSRAIRKPSDLGFDDGPFILPELIMREHTVRASKAAPGFLFDLPAKSLPEQREEQRRTIRERCEMAAGLATHDRPAVAWCHLNAEGDLLAKLIPDAVQVSGKDSDDAKEEKLIGFVRGDFRALVGKPSVCGFGLNWQHCAHQTFFPSHSWEQFYQAYRRSYRFGQKNPVTVDVITTEGGADVLKSLNRKAMQADAMFATLVSLMNNFMNIHESNRFVNPEVIPSWV